jgi:glutathione S-transferase
MYILYNHPWSQHARRIIALMQEAGLEYELRHVALDKGEHRSAEYLAINPDSQVPAFVDGEVTICQSNAVLRYLCAKHDLEDWYPRDPARLARVEQWLDWNQCKLAPTVADIVLNKVFLGDKGDPEALARGEKNLTRLAPILEAGLEGDDYLAGDAPTIADLSVASNITQLGIADATPSSPKIADWYGRVSAMKGFAFSLPEAQMAKES